MPSPKRPWIWIVAVTLLVFLALGGFLLSRQLGDPDRWPREVDAYNLRYALPADQDATPLYLALRVPVSTTVRGWTRLGGPVDNWKMQDWSLPCVSSDLALLEGKEETQAAFIEASRRPGCFHRMSADPNSPLSSPVLHTLQHGANALALDARRKAGEGKVDEAAEALMAIVRAGYQQRAPVIVDLVGTALRGIAWPKLERLAMDAPPSPEALEGMARELETLAGRRMSPEEFWSISQNLAQGAFEQAYRPGGVRDPNAMRRIVAGPSWPSAEEFGLWMRESVLHPIDRSRQEIEEAFRLLKQDPVPLSDVRRLKALEASGGFFVKALIPTYQKARGVRLRELVCERGTRLLLKVRAHRLRHGSYPDAVEPLEDPFTGKPFVYRKLPDDAFLLYSTGPDGIDDGGSFDTDLRFGRPPTP